MTYYCPQALHETLGWTDIFILASKDKMKACIAIQDWMYFRRSYGLLATMTRIMDKPTDWFPPPMLSRTDHCFLDTANSVTIGFCDEKSRKSSEACPLCQVLLSIRPDINESVLKSS